MGRIYREKDVHGVVVIYVENYKTRIVKKVYVGPRSTWMLLPDGRVGCNDLEFFKHLYSGPQRRDVWAAEALWRLGAIKKAVFEKLQAAQKQHEDRKNRGYAIDEFKTAAKKLGIQLTGVQVRAISKPGDASTSVA